MACFAYSAKTGAVTRSAQPAIMPPGGGDVRRIAADRSQRLIVRIRIEAMMFRVSGSCSGRSDFLIHTQQVECDECRQQGR